MTTLPLFASTFKLTKSDGPVYESLLEHEVVDTVKLLLVKILDEFPEEVHFIFAFYVKVEEVSIVAFIW